MSELVDTHKADLLAALQHLGFSSQSAADIMGDQGIDNLEELKVLDDKEVESLCKVVRKPGDPTSTAGTTVSLWAEANLKLAVYYLKYLERTSRQADASNITLANVRSYRAHKLWELEHKDVAAPTINMKDWPKTIQSLIEYLKRCLGVTKIPLAYVNRDEPGVFPDPQGGHITRQQELIARAPILAVGGFTQTYLDDRSKVWELLSALTRDLECWSYVMPAQKNRDGRTASFNLKLHYLGVNNVDNMAATAEKKLQTNSYTSETRKWNFEKYMRIHVDQHAILNGLQEHGYAGIDKQTMVRYLTTGIKTTSLDHVKTRILSDAGLREIFPACVNLFQDFITHKEAESPNITIAAMNNHNQQQQPNHKINHRNKHVDIKSITTYHLNSTTVNLYKSHEIMCELDSHADTCVVGTDTSLIIADYERPIHVRGYSPKVGKSTECKTVSAVLQYTHDNGINYMLIINQAICIPDMEVNLICPMQLRDNDVEVNDLPKSMQSDPSVYNHTIIADNLLITLNIKGIISYFAVTKPNKEEWENSSTDNHIVLTYESPTWDPHLMRFQAAEEVMTDHTGSIITPRDKRKPNLPDHTLGHHYCMQASTIGTTGLGGKVSATQLAQQWKVSLEAAHRTIEATTQHGVRSVLHDTFHRRFRTNDRQLRYRRLPCDMFTDTLEAAKPSWHRKNKYAQVFATRYCWVCVFPMQKKSDAHEGLSLMAACDGVQVTIVMDNTREQTMGMFRKKAREMG